MSLQVSQMMKEYDPERAELIKRCGTYLEFAMIPDGSLKLHRANFCRQRLCPLCQWRRSIKLRTQADQIYRTLQERGYGVIFATLTVRNCTGAELSKTVDHLIESAQRWKRSETYTKAIEGAYRALEITYNKQADTYHPHLHFLLSVKQDYFSKTNEHYITLDDLIRSWRRAARLDYDPSVSIEGLHPKGGQTITDACAELCKYPAKTAEFTDWHVLQNIDYALRGRRLIQWSGCAADVRRELELDDIETGNLVQTVEGIGEEELQKIIYVWRYGMYIPMDWHTIEEAKKRLEA